MLNDIRKELKALKATRRDLRNFGLLFFVVFGLISGYRFWRGHADWPYFAAAGAAFLVVGLAAPGILSGFFRAWLALSLFMGYIMSRVILTLTFLFAIIPMGLLTRLLGKDLLDQRFQPDAKSYWKEYKGKTDRERFRKPY